MREFFLSEQPFLAYGATHWAMLALFALGAWHLTLIGRRHHGTPAEVRFRHTLAIVLLVVPVSLTTYALLPQNFHISHSLPFHLCDLAWIVAGYALWTRSVQAFWLLYYWGLTLTTQGFVTPLLRHDYPHLQFIMFWGLHLGIVWATVYLTFGLGLRPDWRAYRFTIAVTVAWGVLMLAFNSIAGTNYMFVIQKPEVKSLLDLLGPWPWYLLSELAIGMTVWALITLPWIRRRPDS